MQVKLNVRTQSLSGGDLELECQLDWSVLKVKEEIQKRIDSHPKPEDQRLVYAGKLLDNFSILNHVLRMEDGIESHTVHLVCKQLNAPDSTQKSELRQRKKPDDLYSGNINEPHQGTSNHNQSNNLPILTNNFDPTVWEEALRQHHMMYASSPANDQNYWLNQMYSQYMAQYMQYLQTSGAIPMNGNNVPLTANLSPAPHQTPPGVNEPPPPQPAAPAVGGGGQGVGQNDANMMMNAGAGGALGAMEDDEELGGQRDVLDWFYVGSRILVLFSIVYFYSSLARFALVTSLGIAAYLWNVGFFGRRQQRQQNPRQEQQQQQQEIIDQVRQAQAAEGNRNEEVEPEEAAETDDNTSNQDDSRVPVATPAEAENMQINQTPEVDPEAGNPLATTFTFITTFFSSLLPEQPQVI